MENNINESGAARALNAMRGLVPSIHSIAIITAENKNDTQQSAEENNKQNKELKKLLSYGHHGYQYIELGKYGGVPEHGFMVRNVSRYYAIELGKMFEQDSIIYGEKFEDETYYGMYFEMIGTDVNKNLLKILGTNKVFVNRQNETDFFSQIKGRRFQIPFFDKSYDEASWEKGTIIGKKDEMDKDDVDKIEDLNEQTINAPGSLSYRLRYEIKEIFDRYTKYKGKK